MQTMSPSKNIILIAMCSSILLMSTYLLFLKPIDKTAGLTETYLNFIDTIDKHKLESNYVKVTIKELSTNSSFNYCGIAGYSGARIPVINPTPILQRSLSESQLITLCEQSGPVVKHFAFKALYQINYESAKKLFEKRISDTSILTYQCGCIGTPVSINLDFLNTIRGKITNMETISYLQRIKPRLSLFMFKSSTEFLNL